MIAVPIGDALPEKRPRGLNPFMRTPSQEPGDFFVPGILIEDRESIIKPRFAKENSGVAMFSGGLMLKRQDGIQSG